MQGTADDKKALAAVNMESSFYIAAIKLTGCSAHAEGKYMCPNT